MSTTPTTALLETTAATLETTLAAAETTAATEPPPTEPGEPDLPQTGQLNWPIPLMAVAGLGFFVVGWTLCFGKKREHNEK